MKLRCDQNSLRLRLRRSEIEKFRLGESLRTDVYFSYGFSFSYELRHDPDATEIRATSFGGAISIAVPTELAKKWANSDEIALEQFQKIDHTTNLHILIEKDFPCKDRPDEDKTDFFTELADKSTISC